MVECWHICRQTQCEVLTMYDDLALEDSAVLLVCCRRAKRLQKLTRALISPAVQATVHRFKQHMIALMVIMLAVHLTGFAVLTQEVDHNYQ